MKALFALLVVAAGLAPSAWGQHFTARLFTAGHRPQHVKQLLFSPTGAYLAAHADDGVLFFHVATGRETKSYRVSPLAMAFTPSGHQLLAVASDGAAYLPSEEGIATNAKWQLPLGYLGVTFVKQSGKILVEHMKPGGPAALSGQIHVGDEIVAVTTGG